MGRTGKDKRTEISVENKPVCRLSYHIDYKKNILFRFYTPFLFFTLSFSSALCAVTDFTSCAQNMNILELRSLKGTMKWPEVKSYPISSITEQIERGRETEGERGGVMNAAPCISQ